MYTDEDKTARAFRIDLPAGYEGLTDKERELIQSLPGLTEEEQKKINRCFTPYIFFRRDGKEYRCYCTRCDREFTARTAFHNELRYCPNCGDSFLAKGAYYSQKNLTEQINITLFRRHRGKVIALNFRAAKAYAGHPWSKWENRYYKGRDFQRMPDIFLDYRTLYIWQKGKAARYQNEQTYGSHGWVQTLSPSKTPIRQALPSGGMYTSGYAHFYINQTIPGLSKLFRYVPMEKAGDFDLCAFLSAYALYPILEFVMKAGLDTLAKDLIWRGKKNYRLCDWTALTPRAFFRNRLNAAEIREMIEGKHGPDTVLQYIRYRDSGKRCPMAQVMELGKINEYIPRYRKAPLTPEEFDRIAKYLRTHSSTPDRQGFHFYADYLDMAEGLGFDLDQKNVRFPRDLFAAHDNALALRKDKLIRDEAARLRAQEEAYEKLKKKYRRTFGAFRFPGVIVRVPENAEEIIREGAALEHCVGSYAARHLRGETTILFLRRPEEPDKPWFTLEVRDGKLLQCHGFKNERLPGGVRVEKPGIILAFERAFEDWLKGQPRKKAS